MSQWYHVAFVLNGSTAYIYVNGIQQATKTIIKANDVNRKSNFIGKSNWQGDQNADAIYDELKIFYGAMQAAQVFFDYTVTSPYGSLHYNTFLI